MHQGSCSCSTCYSLPAPDLMPSCSAESHCPNRAGGLACGRQVAVALFLSASLSLFVPWEGIPGVLASSCQNLRHSLSAAPVKGALSNCSFVCEILSVLLLLLVLRPSLWYQFLVLDFVPWQPVHDKEKYRKYIHAICINSLPVERNSIY